MVPQSWQMADDGVLLQIATTKLLPRHFDVGAFQLPRTFLLVYFFYRLLMLVFFFMLKERRRRRKKWRRRARARVPKLEFSSWFFFFGCLGNFSHRFTGLNETECFLSKKRSWKTLVGRVWPQSGLEMFQANWRTWQSVPWAWTRPPIFCVCLLLNSCRINVSLSVT